MYFRLILMTSSLLLFNGTFVQPLQVLSRGKASNATSFHSPPHAPSMGNDGDYTNLYHSLQITQGTFGYWWVDLGEYCFVQFVTIFHRQIFFRRLMNARFFLINNSQALGQMAVQLMKFHVTI